MKKGKPEVLCSSDTNPRDELLDVQEQPKEVKEESQRRKRSAIQRKAKDESQPMEEDQHGVDDAKAPAKVDKYVRRLKKEQLAQRDVIDKMQILIQDLVKVLKESHIQQPTPTQQATTEPKESDNEPMEAKSCPSTEEEKESTPEPDDQENEEEVHEEEGSQAEDQEQEEASQKEDPIDPKMEKREMKDALKLKMKEKLRAMRMKAKRRAKKKRVATAAAKEAVATKEAVAGPSSAPDTSTQEAPVKSRKRKDKETPPKDESFRSKRGR